MTDSSQRRLHHKVTRLARTKWAVVVLTFVTFANSSFFPIPQDAILLPMMMARPKRAFALASLCTVASTLGGILGYFIGSFLFDTVGLYILSLYNQQDNITQLQDFYHRYGFLIITFGAITPLPYKLVTIGSGLLGFNFLFFVVASLIGRAIRFYAYFVVFYFFGDKIYAMSKQWFHWIALFVVAACVFILVYTFKDIFR